jgi:MoaA/NifB/PqqE/SkfB family radical SAM enzyme
MTPELQKEFDDASQPFIDGGGAIGLTETRQMPWRVFLEINSVCTLHCPTCTKGGHEGYEHESGIMDTELMEKIILKIQRENPKAIVFLYGNSEPFVHPRLASCIRAVKAAGLNAQLSTNLNFVRKLDDVLEARPDMIIISLSGFTQEIYERGHAGGDIEKVKANMRLIADANGRLIQKDGGGKGVDIQVNFHIYKDNQHEVELMREFCKNLGLGFFTSYARAISMENAIQYCRREDPFAVPFDNQDGKPDYNAMLPPVGQTYIDAMKRVVITPDKAVEMYKDLEAPRACPIGTMFTFIRHDGKTEMCACVADRRLTLGDYLDTTQEKLTEQRMDHPVCQQCSRYKLRYYFHLTGHKQWEPPL